ncbi:phosphoribosylanthranilate isomerase [Terrihabitans sp. B22-R8]|uniref:phosphoribosylanthranilate isomerase n=1 Tax=Terrihabitans sp. B22-R8 TaxID=3425128 RepID=UPI00403C7E22
MPTEIKICGLRDAATLDAALDAGADDVGFVFFERSPRHIGLDAAAELAKRARGRAVSVALVVNPDDALLDAIMAQVAPDVVQFHGQEDAAQLERFRARHGARLWKALPVSTAEDLRAVSLFADVADRVLFDAKPPKGAERPGGHGQTFDWNVLRGLDPQTRFMLSGGLNPGNVAEAVQATGAEAVDVSSGVENTPGEKSPDLIRAFVRAVRGAEARQETLSA